MQYSRKTPKTPPSNQFWKHPLRAPFAVTERENISCISSGVEGKNREEGRKCINLMHQLSYDGMASWVSSWVLGRGPASQQGTKINVGSFGPVNEAAMKTQQQMGAVIELYSADVSNHHNRALRSFLLVSRSRIGGCGAPDERGFTRFCLIRSCYRFPMRPIAGRAITQGNQLTLLMYACIDLVRKINLFKLVWATNV